MANLQIAGDEAVNGLVRLVQSTYAEASTIGDEQALARLERAWDANSRRSRPGFAFRFLVPAFAAIALIGAGVSLFRRHERLTYEVVNGTLGTGGFVRPTGEGTTLVFSEGSEIALDEAARARVDSLTSDGGRVVVESGSVHARIVPRKHARWTVEAGPYTIRVTGTAFRVRWSWTDERFEVQMQRGSVVVSGPLAPAGVTLTAGMNLTANPNTGLSIGGAPASAPSGLPVGVEGPVDEAFVGAAEGTNSDLAPPGSDSQAAGADVDEEGASAAPPSSAAHARTSVRRSLKSASARRSAPATAPADAPSGSSRTSWARLLAKGDVQGVLADADARGIEGVLISVAVSELSTLADAARYGHRPEMARRVLLSVRTRFPRSPEARDAAFFLGGLAEDAPISGGEKMAFDWYERYLTDSPTGRYVAQALGRKMLMTQRMQGLESARPIAKQYLERFPSGPYAAAARKLVQSH